MSLAVWLASTGSVAAAEPTPPASAVEKPAETQPAPRADRAHGRRKAPRTDAKTVMLWFPRAILFVPRYAIDIAVHPIRLGLMAYDKYGLRRRIEDAFFNDERTFGAYPLAFAETGFGLNVGARLVHRDLFGHGEALRARASFGGLYRQRYELSLDTGSALGERFKLGTSARYAISPRARFFGIGNADEETFTEDELPIAATEGAVRTRYRRDELLARLGARVRLGRRFRLLLMEELAWRRFGPSDSSGHDLEEAYDTSTVTGFEEGQVRSFSEAALVLDTTESDPSPVARVTPSRGWLARAGGGIGLGFVDDPSRYVRWTVDVQRFIDLRRGNRVLRLRGLADVVDAPLSRVVFVDLPTLGGPSMLRGYPRERFRGRLAAMGTAEYSWPIDRFITGFLFTDVGRVWNSLPLQADRPRVGFGGGLLLVSPRRFLARLQFASTIDGGFAFNLQFDPAWEIYDDV